MDLFIPSFVLGLVTSLHCVSMCGPMVVTYALKGTEDGPAARSLVPNLAYQAAKIASYMVVGLLLGALGAAVKLDAIRPYVMLVAGLFMIVLALGMTGRFPWAAKLTPRPPQFLLRAISSLRRKAVSDAESHRPSLATPISFGLLTGLMPCAPLMAAQLNAASSGSATRGALAMLAFGLGTAPLMLAFGTASSLIPRRFREKMTVVLALVVLLFGVTYLNRSAALLGSPFTLQSAAAAVFGGKAAGTAKTNDVQYTVAPDGVAEVRVTIENTQYVPDVVTIPAGRPVRLVVDRREDNSCSSQIAVPQLGVLADLAPNAVTNVDLPVTKAGSYTLTCGMGMMSGRLVAVEATSKSGASNQTFGSKTTVANPASSSAATSAGTTGAGSFASACSCFGGGGASAATVDGTAIVTGGVQQIRVETSTGSWNPNRIVLKAGIPAEITFAQASGCLGQVQSQQLGFFEDLTTGDKTVKLSAADLKPGTYSFTCGMQMVSGTIVVQ